MMVSPQNLGNDIYVHEVSRNLKEKREKNLALLLDHFPFRDAKTKSRILFEISMMNSNDVFFALDHLISVPDLSVHDKNKLLDIFLEKSLSNSHFIIPFIDHADKKHLQSAVSVFANILLNETDTYILQKSLRAIGESGDPSCINVVADFIFYDHDELKREAVDALSKIGGSSAIKRLAFASKTSKSDPYLVSVLERMQAGTRSTVKNNSTSQTRQFASKKDRLNDLDKDSDIAQLLLMLKSDSPHTRHIAIDGLIEIGPKVIPAICDYIDKSDIDALINGMDVLGNIRHEAALPFILGILKENHDDSNVRFSVYEALSRLPCTHLPVLLIDGITDSSEQVRLAAATAINRSATEIMIAGLKSRLETSGRKSKRNQIISAVIDSYSGHIFSRLMDSDTFVFHALEYLVQSHPMTISFFTRILESRGTLSHVRNIQRRTESRGPNKGLTIFCVDDSSICLKLYLRIFHTMGHIPIIFETPDALLTSISTRNPDLVITDLNMLAMNGLQLAEEIRKSKTTKDFPILIVTTQENFVAEYHSKNGLFPMIDGAIRKPPVTGDFKQFLNHPHRF